MKRTGVGLVLVGAAAVFFFLGAKKKANASPGQLSPDQNEKAQYLAALQQNIASGESYEDYVAILTDAYKAGALTMNEIADLQPRHPMFPRAA